MLEVLGWCAVYFVSPLGAFSHRNVLSDHALLKLGLHVYFLVPALISKPVPSVTAKLRTNIEQPPATFLIGVIVAFDGYDIESLGSDIFLAPSTGLNAPASISKLRLAIQQLVLVTVWAAKLCVLLCIAGSSMHTRSAPCSAISKFIGSCHVSV